MESVIPLSMFASLMFVGLVAGILLATELGQVRVQKRLGARDFTLVKHDFEMALGRVMPVLVIAAGVSIIPLLLLLAPRGRVPFIAALVALLLWVGVILVTLVVNAPINALARHWDPETPPEDWEELRRRWHLGQAIRTPLAVAAFAGVTLACVFPVGLSPLGAAPPRLEAGRSCCCLAAIHLCRSTDAGSGRPYRGTPPCRFASPPLTPPKP